MGAPVMIAVVLIALLIVGYVVWTMTAAGRGAAAAGKSMADDHPPETAPHSDEHTRIRRVDSSPPDDQP